MNDCISNCCKAETRIEGDSEGTRYYVCTKCGKACDLWTGRQKKKKVDKEEQKADEDIKSGRISFKSAKKAVTWLKKDDFSPTKLEKIREMLEESDNGNGVPDDIIETDMVSVDLGSDENSDLIREAYARGYERGLDTAIDILEDDIIYPKVK